MKKFKIILIGFSLISLTNFSFAMEKSPQENNQQENIPQEEKEQKENKLLKINTNLILLKQLDDNNFITFDLNKKPQIKILENKNIKKIIFNNFFQDILLNQIKDAIKNKENSVILKNVIDKFWDVYDLEIPINYNKFSNQFELNRIYKKNKKKLPISNFSYPYKNFEGLKSNPDYITYSGKIYDICHDSKTNYKNENNLIVPFKELQFSKEEENKITEKFKLFEKPDRLKEILKSTKEEANKFINENLDFSKTDKIEKKVNIPDKDLSFSFELIENSNFEDLNIFENILDSNEFINPLIFNITVFNLRKNQVNYFNFPPIIIIPAVKFTDEIKNELKRLFNEHPNEKIENKVIENIIKQMERQAAKKIKNLNLKPTSKNESPKPIKIQLPAKCRFVKKILEVEIFFKHNGIFFNNFVLKD